MWIAAQLAETAEDRAGTGKAGHFLDKRIGAKDAGAKDVDAKDYELNGDRQD